MRGLDVDRRPYHARVATGVMAGSSLSPVVQGVFTPLRLLLVAAVYIKLCHGSAGVVDTTVAFSTTDLIGSPTVATTSSPTIPATSSTTSSTTVSTTSSTTVPTTSSTVFEGSMVSEKKCSTNPTGSTDSADPTDFTRPKSPEILVSSTSSASFVTSVTSVTVRKTVPCYSVSNSTGGYKDNTRIPDIFNYCCPDVEDGVYGVVHWPTTRAGHHSSQKCPFGSRKDPEGRYGIAKAYRACERYTSVGPKWKPSDYSRCKAQGSDERDAAESAEEAERITSNPANITGETFRQATEMIEKSHQLAFSNRTVARSMLQAMSNLVAASPKAQQDGDADGQQRLKLFLLMESHGRGVVMPDEERRYEQRMSNLHLVVQKVPPAMETLPSTFNFNVNFIDSSEDTSLLRLAPDGGPPGDLRSPTSSKVRIVLPKEAIEQVLKKNPDTHLSEVRLRFMAMRNARLLPPPGTQSGMQNVVSASISPTQSDEEVGKDFEVRDLRTPVKIRMPFGKWGATHVCSYYDIKTDEWKSDGLRTLLDQGDEVECESNHLTPFSLLLDPYPRNGLGDLIVPLEIVSYLGSVLSILGLTATIITYQFFSRFGKDRWSRVLVQLCTSLLLLHLTYLSSNLKGAIPPECCAAVAALLHVFLLSSFFWMLVEAMLLYQLLITVFQSANSKFMLKRLVFAWGLPVLIVVASAAVEPRYYFDTHSDFCLPSAYNRVQHSVTAILPCCTVLVINVIIFIRISFVLLRRRIPPGFRSDTNETPTVTWAQVRGMIGVAFLLGVTWVLSPLSMDMVALQLASSAVNALQGVAIFVSRVLTHPEARRSWKHRFFPKNEFLSTSATYSVSDKGSSWFRIRWSVTSGTVATAPSPPKEGKDSARSRRLSTLWSKQMSPSRGSSSLSLGVTRNGSETYLT